MANGDTMHAQWKRFIVAATLGLCACEGRIGGPPRDLVGPSGAGGNGGAVGTGGGTGAGMPDPMPTPSTFVCDPAAYGSVMVADAANDFAANVYPLMTPAT